MGEVGKVVTGKTPSTKDPENFGGDYPFITIPDLKDQRYVVKTDRTVSEKGANILRSIKLPKNSVVMSCLATVGETGITVKESFTNQQINAIIPYAKVADPEFLYYLFRKLKRQFQNYDGSVYINISKSKFEDIEVGMPGVDEQKRIAEMLSAFDEKIENNNCIIKTLEEMAQAIFKEWFVENQKGKAQTVKLNELVQIISGHPFSSSLYVTDKQALGVVTIKNVQDGDFVTDCGSRIREVDVPRNMNKECRLQERDILLSLTGNVGRVCFIYGGQYLLNQRVAKIKPRNVDDQALAYFLFRQSVMQNRLINMAKGSAQPNLSPVETGAVELEIPSRDVLDQFSNLATPTFQQIVEQTLENQKLAAMRDLLLPRLMSGEIQV